MMHFTHILTISTLVLLTLQKSGFERHGSLAFVCKPMHILNHLSDVENENINMIYKSVYFLFLLSLYCIVYV